MNRYLILPVVLAAGCGRPAGDGKGEPLPDGLATAPRAFEVVVKSAKIKPTKPDGSKWDFGTSKPDPYVRVSVMEGDKLTRHGQTKVINGSLNPVWNETVLAVDAGEWLVFHVKDKDLQFDDRIGLHLEAVTTELAEKGEVRMAFDQVEELVVVVRKSAAVVRREEQEAAAARARDEAEATRRRAEADAAERARLEAAKAAATQQAAAQAAEAERQRIAALAQQQRDAAAEQLRQARETESRLVRQISELNNQLTTATLAAAAANTAYQRTEPGSGGEFVAEAAFLAAQRVQRELQNKIQAAQHELQIARDQIRRLQM